MAQVLGTEDKDLKVNNVSPCSHQQNLAGDAGNFFKMP
jgi:hypothetical protein